MIERVPPVLATSLAAALLAAPTAGAASSLRLYGQETAGTGGVVPRIWALDTAWPGNHAFGVTLDSAVGGGSGFLIVGSAPLDAYGPGFWVNVAPLFISPPIALSGTAGAPAQGDVALTLAVPNLPVLVGVDAYFQWAVADAGATFGYAATRGLRLTITDPPLVVVAGSLGGVATDPIYAIDPLTGAIADWSNLDENVDVELSPNGSLAVVSASQSNQFGILDAASGALLGGAATNGEADSVVFTPDGTRAYCLAKATSSNPAAEILEMDVDPTSATFGQVIGFVSGWPATMSQWTGGAISADGTVLTVANFGIAEQPGVVIVDVAPGSATRNTVTGVVPVTGGGFVRDVVPNEDGTLAYAAVQYLSPLGEMIVIDVAAGAVVQTVTNIGGFPNDLDVDARGRFAYVACQLNGWVARIDIDPSSGGYLSSTPSTVVPAAFNLALSPEGDRVYVTPQAGGAITELDAVTLGITNTWNLPLSAFDLGISVR